MDSRHSFAYSIRQSNPRISKVITNPLTNTFNSVDAIVDNINIAANLPPLNPLNVAEDNIPFNPIVADNQLEVSYPDTPSFLPNSDDISFFKMISDGMVTSMKDSTENDFRSECCVPYYDRIMTQSCLSEEEKRICDLKLQRFEYENKRSAIMKEDDDPDIRTVNSHSHSGEDKSDRRYINDFVSSHFHNLLTPSSLASTTGTGDTPGVVMTTTPSYHSTRTGGSEEISEIDSMMSSYVDLLEETIHDNESIMDDPVVSYEKPSRYSSRMNNVPVTNQFSTFYAKAKETDKKQNTLPLKQDLTQHDYGGTLPHRTRTPSSSTISSISTTRSTASSADISSFQGELWSILNTVSNMDDGVNRINEIKKCSKEMTDTQRSNRQSREDMTTMISPTVWKSVDNIYDHERKQTEVTYDSMISLRLSYRPGERGMSLDQGSESSDGDTLNHSVSQGPSTTIPYDALVSEIKLSEESNPLPSQPLQASLNSDLQSEAGQNNQSITPLSQSSNSLTQPPAEPIIIEKPRFRDNVRQNIPVSQADIPDPVLSIPKIPGLQKQTVGGHSSQNVIQTRSSIRPPTVTTPTQDSLNSSLPVPSTPSNGSQTPTPAITIPLPKRSFILSNRNSRMERRSIASIRDGSILSRSVRENLQGENGEEMRRRSSSPTRIDLHSSSNSVNSNGSIRNSYNSGILNASAALSRSRRSMYYQHETIPELSKEEPEEKNPQPESSQSDVSRVSIVLNDNAEGGHMEVSCESDKELGVSNRRRELSTAEILGDDFGDDIITKLSDQLF